MSQQSTTTRMSVRVTPTLKSALQERSVEGERWERTAVRLLTTHFSQEDRPALPPSKVTGWGYLTSILATPIPHKLLAQLRESSKSSESESWAVEARVILRRLLVPAKAGVDDGHTTDPAALESMLSLVRDGAPDHPEGYPVDAFKLLKGLRAAAGMTAISDRKYLTKLLKGAFKGHARVGEDTHWVRRKRRIGERKAYVYYLSILGTKALSTVLGLLDVRKAIEQWESEQMGIPYIEALDFDVISQDSPSPLHPISFEGI